MHSRKLASAIGKRFGRVITPRLEPPLFARTTTGKHSLGRRPTGWTCRLNRPLAHESRFCWTAAVGLLGDDTMDPVRSAFFLFEDGIELGPAHCSIAEIRSMGMGRFCHWETRVYFSSSDNSDPNINGRNYELRYLPDRQVDHFVRYSISTAEFYQSYIPNGWSGVEGNNVLEIGPGRDLGAAMIFAGLGAKVTCIEKFHDGWDDNWHPQFFAKLLGAVKNTGLKIDEGPFLRSIRAGDFDPKTIKLHACELEKVPKYLHGTFDISLSHAVFEHFENTPKAMKALFALLKAGALGIHRIDFRDHRNFERPLDFLLIPDPVFDEQTGDNKYVHGNRLRLNEYTSVIKRAGFRKVEFIKEQQVDSDYLASFIRQLRGSNSRYSNHSEGDLSCLSGVFVLQS